MNITVCVVLLASGLASSLGTAQSLVRVPSLPGGEKAVIADMSADGSTLVSSLGGSAYRLRAGAWEMLAAPAGASVRVHAVSANGDFVAGDVRQDFVQSAAVFRDGAWRITDTGDNANERTALFVSADGSRVLGSSVNIGGGFDVNRSSSWNGSAYVPGPQSPFAASNNMTNFPNDGSDSNAWRGMTPDGTSAISTSSNPVESAAIRYGDASAPFGRPSTVQSGPGFFSEDSEAYAISADGGVIYGRYKWLAASAPSFDGQRFFRWTLAGGTQLLSESLPLTFGTDEVSADGNIWVLGDGSLYLHSLGLAQSAATFLAGAGVDLTGWSALRITEISTDGLTFAGVGTFSTGAQTTVAQPWTVTIPTPGSLVLVGVAGWMASRRRR